MKYTVWGNMALKCALLYGALLTRCACAVWGGGGTVPGFHQHSSQQTAPSRPQPAPSLQPARSWNPLMSEAHSEREPNPKHETARSVCPGTGGGAAGVPLALPRAAGTVTGGMAHVSHALTALSYIELSSCGA